MIALIVLLSVLTCSSLVLAAYLGRDEPRRMRSGRSDLETLEQLFA